MPSLQEHARQVVVSIVWGKMLRASVPVEDRWRFGNVRLLCKAQDTE